MKFAFSPKFAEISQKQKFSKISKNFRTLTKGFVLNFEHYIAHYIAIEKSR